MLLDHCEGIIVLSFAVFHGVLSDSTEPVAVADYDGQEGGVGEAEVVNALGLGRGEPGTCCCAQVVNLHSQSYAPTGLHKKDAALPLIGC